MENTTSLSQNGLKHFPLELRARPQWVVWREETRKGKPTKVPYSPITGKKASSTKSATWGTLEQALTALNRTPARHNGVGFVFTKDDPYCGIDIDWKDWEGEDIPLEAQTIIERFDSYTEWSPSGKGCHIIIKGVLPSGGNRKRIAPGVEVELYDSRRYFTVTDKPI